MKARKNGSNLTVHAALIAVVVTLSSLHASATLVSASGTVWGAATAPNNYDYFSVIHVNGEFVALNDYYLGTRIVTSVDGHTWTMIGSIPDGGIDGTLAYGNGRYVYINNSCGNGTLNCMWTSTDKTTWQPMPLASSRLRGLISLAYGNGRFVAIGKVSTNPPFLNAIESTDGIGWTDTLQTQTFYGGEFSASARLLFANGSFFVEGTDGSPNRVSGFWKYSTDAPWTFFARQNGCRFLKGLAYGSSRFLTPQNSGHCKSTNGTMWTSIPDNSPSYQTKDITFAAGRYYAAGNYAGGKAYSSVDGTAWFLEGTPGNPSPTRIIAGGGHVVEVGEYTSGIIYGDLPEKIFTNGFESP